MPGYIENQAGALVVELAKARDNPERMTIAQRVNDKEMTPTKLTRALISILSQCFPDNKAVKRLSAFYDEDVTQESTANLELAEPKMKGKEALSFLMEQALTTSYKITESNQTALATAVILAKQVGKFKPGFFARHYLSSEQLSEVENAIKKIAKDADIFEKNFNQAVQQREEEQKAIKLQQEQAEEKKQPEAAQSQQPFQPTSYGELQTQRKAAEGTLANIMQQIQTDELLELTFELFEESYKEREDLLVREIKEHEANTTRLQQLQEFRDQCRDTVPPFDEARATQLDLLPEEKQQWQAEATKDLITTLTEVAASGLGYVSGALSYFSNFFNTAPTPETHEVKTSANSSATPSFRDRLNEKCQELSDTIYRREVDWSLNNTGINQKKKELAEIKAAIKKHTDLRSELVGLKNDREAITQKVVAARTAINQHSQEQIKDLHKLIGAYAKKRPGRIRQIALAMSSWSIFDQKKYFLHTKGLYKLIDVAKQLVEANTDAKIQTALKSVKEIPTSVRFTGKAKKLYDGLIQVAQTMEQPKTKQEKKQPERTQNWQHLHHPEPKAAQSTADEETRTQASLPIQSD